MLSYCFAVVVIFSSLCFCAAEPCSPCNKNSENQLEKLDSGKLRSPLREGEHIDISSTDSVVTKAKRRCCPYNFDSRLCQVVNDRLLCGYNRNVGMPHNDAVPFQLSGGCRIRGGRLECGYEKPPYMNMRRPPAWNQEPAKNLPRLRAVPDPDYDEAYYDEDGKLLLKKTKSPKDVTKK